MPIMGPELLDFFPSFTGGKILDREMNGERRSAFEEDCSVLAREMICSGNKQIIQTIR